MSVTWAAANPEALPFPDDHFDRALSAVGPLAMAPDQPQVATLSFEQQYLLVTAEAPPAGT